MSCGCGGGCGGGEPVIDVRVIAPRERHPVIFTAFGMLDRGEGFFLVNDHDPRPLRDQFQARYPGAFSWEYLEQGPDVWRIRVARAA